MRLGKQWSESGPRSGALEHVEDLGDILVDLRLLDFPIRTEHLKNIIFCELHVVGKDYADLGRRAHVHNVLDERFTLVPSIYFITIKNQQKHIKIKINNEEKRCLGCEKRRSMKARKVAHKDEMRLHMAALEIHSHNVLLRHQCLVSASKVNEIAAFFDAWDELEHVHARLIELLNDLVVRAL